MYTEQFIRQNDRLFSQRYVDEKVSSTDSECYLVPKKYYIYTWFFRNTSELATIDVVSQSK